MSEKDFWLTVRAALIMWICSDEKRAALIMFVRTIEKRYNLKQHEFTGYNVSVEK